MNWIVRCCLCCSASVTEVLCYIGWCVTFLAHVWGMWTCNIWSWIGFSNIIPKIILSGGGGGGGLKTSKGILENFANARKKKLKNLKILEQFHYSVDILGTFYRQNRWKTVFAYRPRVDSVRSHDSSVWSTVHWAQQISGFLSESSALQLISDYSPKGAHAIRKTKFY